MATPDVETQGIKQKTKRILGVGLVVQRLSRSTSTHKPPGSILVGDPLFRSFSPFRVWPCAHTERSANFGHVPIPAGSLGCTWVTCLMVVNFSYTAIVIFCWRLLLLGGYTDLEKYLVA